MAKFDPLFSLIKSLSKSEKRYFRMMTGTHGKNQKYLKLFETMNKMEVYDEPMLKADFARYSDSDQIHVVKNYLNGLIMKSLRDYHQKDSVSACIKSRLIDIELLYKRDLMKQCYRAICQAEALVVKAGEENARLEILNWKRKVLLQTKGVTGSISTLTHISELEQATLQHLSDESRLWELTLEVSSPNRKNMSEYLNHPLITSSSKAKTYRAKILNHHLRYVTYTMSSNPKAAEKALDQLIQFLESDTYKLKSDPAPYITAINNKIGLYLNQRRHNLIPPLLDKIRRIPKVLKLKTTSAVSMKLLARTYNVELETYRDLGQVEKAILLIPEVKSFLENHQDHVPREYKILLHYQFAYLYFMHGDFRLSLLDINSVLRHRNFPERTDIIGFAQFLNLIIHYELGNATVMKYSVNSSRRYLQKKRGIQNYEKILLRFFARLSTTAQAQHGSIFNQYYDKLFGQEPLISDQDLDYLDFKEWFQSKIEVINKR